MKMLHSSIVGILCCLVIVHAEPPVTSSRGKPIVTQKLLNRVADIIANGGDGSTRGDDGTRNIEGPSIVNQDLLDRIARIISQNDGQLSWTRNKGHDDTSPQELSLPSNEVQLSYGVPPVEAPAGAKELAGTLFELSPPEPVPRIAAFDITDEEDDQGYSQQITQQDSYVSSGNLCRGGSCSKDNLRIDQTESALRIASFDIEGQQPPRQYTPPQGRAAGGYSTLRSHN